MKNLYISLWAESLKVRKSKVFIISIIFFVFIACMVGLIMFLQSHPEMSEKMGIIGTKASMMRFGEPIWKNFMSLLLQIVAGVGLVGYGFITSWIYGREYTENTFKDILALPVSRTTIALSKLIVVIVWSILLSLIFLGTSLLIGYMSGLSGWTPEVYVPFFLTFTGLVLLSLLLCTPIAFLTCYSRGILLPIGVIILTIFLANFSGLLGVGAYFPWAIPGLLTVGEGDLEPVSYIILISTSVLGLAGTVAWWRYADHK